jgi:CVNH domain
MRKIKKVLKERKKRVQYEHSRRVYASILVIDFFVATLFAVAAQKSFADNLPAGSYTQSCRDVWVENDTLHASCQTRAGNWITSVLPDISSCGGDISNQDGHLRCNRGAGPPGGYRTQGSPSPRGSYLQSCRDVWVENDTLHASCQTRAGNWITSGLTYISQCRGDISNQDGHLRCNRGAAPPGGSRTQGSPPRGSYTQSCRDVWVANDILHASCQTRAGNWITSVLRDFSSCGGDIANQDGQLRCTVR